MRRRIIDYIVIILVFLFGLSIDLPKQPVFIYQELNSKEKAIVADLQSSTAYIGGSNQILNWSGSGVLIDKEHGIILTAAHVINDSKNILLRFKDGTSCYSEDFYADKEFDIGFIKINPELIKHLKEFKFASQVSIGDDVYICGCPFGEQLAYSISFGKVSGKARILPFLCKIPLIQSDAQSWAGNSGGPVVNSQGELMGILVGGLVYSDGISLILPFDVCKLSYEKYLLDLKLDNFFIGVENE